MNSSENRTVAFLSSTLMQTELQVKFQGLFQMNKEQESVNQEVTRRGSNVKCQAQKTKTSPPTYHTLGLSVLSHHSCLSTFQSYTTRPRDWLQDVPIRIQTIPSSTELGFHTVAISTWAVHYHSTGACLPERRKLQFCPGIPRTVLSLSSLPMPFNPGLSKICLSLLLQLRHQLTGRYNNPTKSFGLLLKFYLSYILIL